MKPFLLCLVFCLISVLGHGQTNIQRTICEGTSFEGYNQTGVYIDTFKVENGEDSIRTLELTVEPFVSLICLPNDTFIIPNGFTYRVFSERFASNYIGAPNAPFVEPSACFREVEIVETGVPRYANTFGVGSTNFEHTIKTEKIDESCTRTIHVKEGVSTEQLPSFLMQDITVQDSTTFCIDVTTKNFQHILGLTLKAYWDSTALEYIRTEYATVFGDNPPLSGIKAPDVAITNWIATDFSNGLTISDSTTIYSLCFKAKKPGQYPVHFFTPYDGTSVVISEVILAGENNTGVSDVWLKSSLVTITENLDCNATTTTEMGTICQGESYILNNQAYNHTGNYEMTFTTENGCDSIVQLTLEVLPVPTAIADTFSIKENQELIVDISQNDVLPANVNWQTSVITPPHVGTLTSLGNGQFAYLPRFAYTGPTSFEYQICNETCLPEGCTTAKVFLDIQSELFGITTTPTPFPPTTSIPTETSRQQSKIEKGELFIYNIWGQQVKKQAFWGDSQKQLGHLQQNELPAGIYFYVKKSMDGQSILESGKLIAIGR